jgi:hypothetical protein
MKTDAELKAVREAQKRNSWIENVKRVKGYSQEEAEKAWTKIFNSQLSEQEKKI